MTKRKENRKSDPFWFGHLKDRAFTFGKIKMKKTFKMDNTNYTH